MNGRNLAAILLGAALLAGCGSRSSDFCSAQTQCEGGNNKDTAACVALSDGAQDEASAYDDFSDAFKVIDYTDKTGVLCRMIELPTQCGDETAALLTCEKAAWGRSSGRREAPVGRAPGAEWRYGASRRPRGGS